MLDQPPSASNSPHDSLSPIDDGPKGKTYSWDQAVDYTTSLLSERCEAGNFSLWKSDVQSRGRNHQLNSEDEVVASDANPTALQEPHSSPFPRSGSIRHELSQASPPSTKACPPRFRLTVSTHRPSELSLTKTNGATTISRAEIKRCILNARIGADNATIVQVPRPKANHLPKTPGTPSPLFVMGNKPSSVSESPAPDDASPRSVVRRLPRQSSLNPAKHLDLKAAVPKDFTATVLRVQRHGSKATLNAFDGADERGSKRDMVSPVSSRENPSAITPPSSSRHATGRTIPNPLFPTPTKGRSASVIESTNPEEDQIADKTDVEETQRGQRGLVLSPSIPAPSPLPEDSPHQYGLKDRMDTPDLAEPEEIKVVKPRRRSSGLEIFHEAKTLQSASSFLNGLSTLRRRAESSTQLGNEPSSWTIASRDTARPYSAAGRIPSRTKLQAERSTERLSGSIFKPSGFAFSRPLNVAQIKCYRNHGRLISTHNKKAPVECAVCHVDDDRDHYSCSWCAIRMCRFCRRDFSERGMTALRERVKQAEFGDSSPDNSSDDLFRTGRG